MLGYKGLTHLSCTLKKKLVICKFVLGNSQCCKNSSNCDRSCSCKQRGSVNSVVNFKPTDSNGIDWTTLYAWCKCLVGEKSHFYRAACTSLLHLWVGDKLHLIKQFIPTISIYLEYHHWKCISYFCTFPRIWRHCDCQNLQTGLKLFHQIYRAQK